MENEFLLRQAKKKIKKCRKSIRSRSVLFKIEPTNDREKNEKKCSCSKEIISIVGQDTHTHSCTYNHACTLHSHRRKRCNPFTLAVPHRCRRVRAHVNVCVCVTRRRNNVLGGCQFELLLTFAPLNRKNNNMLRLQICIEFDKM